jgi:Zn-dependent alcohol dehydrogenase
MFPHSIRVLESGVVSLKALLSHQLPLRDINQGFDAIHAGQAVKVMITP